jgi:hypothetical protein
VDFFVFNQQGLRPLLLEIDMTYNLLDDPDFIYASDEQFKGYCDLDLTNDEWHMAHIVARKIPYHEFQNVMSNNRKKYKGKYCSPSEVLAECYDDIIAATNNPYYHPNQDESDEIDIDGRGIQSFGLRRSILKND